MNKDRARLFVLCTAFLILDVLVFFKAYQWNVEKQRQKAIYEKAVEQYETASALYDESGLSTARSLFLEVAGYLNSDEYIHGIDDELNKIRTYRLAITLYEEERYAAAYDSFASVAGYRDVQVYLNQMSSDVLTAAQKFMQDKNYAEALKLLEAIPESTGDYYVEGTALKNQITAEWEEEDRNKKYLAAVESFENENYKSAMATFFELKEYRESKDYLEKIGELLYSKAQGFYEQGFISSAIECLNEASQVGTWSGYARAGQLKEEIIEDYVAATLENAQKKYYETHDIDEVIRMLTESEKELGSDARIQAAIQDYENNSSAYLSDLKVFSYSEDGEVVNKYWKTNYGDTYKNSVTCDQGYISYLVDGKGYTVFKGVVGCPEGKHSDAYTHGAYIEIIGTKGDAEIVLHTTKEITDETKPISIEVDVSGYEVIYFKWHCKGLNIWGNWGSFATIFEGKFMR